VSHFATMFPVFLQGCESQLPRIAPQQPCSQGTSCSHRRQEAISLSFDITSIEGNHPAIMSTSANPDPAAATESTPLLPGNDTPSQPARTVPRLAIIGQWATAIQGLLVVNFATAVYATYEYYHPFRYRLPYDIQSGLFLGLALVRQLPCITIR